MRYPLLFLAILPLAFAGASLAAAPTSIAETYNICAPVIDEEYRGDKSHWGMCVKATADYLTLVYGPPPTVPDPNVTNADLVYELAKLYRPGPNCPNHETELPDAIEKAASFSTDDKQRVLLLQIAKTIQQCQDLETGTIDEPVEASPN